MLTDAAIERLYAEHIQTLPVEDRLRLLAVIARDLATPETTQPPAERSLLELEGLGAELWQGIEAQQYVDQLRDEWESHR
jgi:hypothetical protein